LSLKRIYCIDSNPADLASLQVILGGRYQLLLLTDPSYAFREILMNQPNLLLVDQEVRGIGALQFIKRINSAEPSLMQRTLLITKDPNAAEVKAITDMGCSGVLLKPYNADLILTSVKMVISRPNTYTSQKRSPFSEPNEY